MSADVVNDLTGEAELVAEDGRTWRLLFDLRAIKEIETQAGQSIADLVIGYDTRRPGVADLERLVISGSKGYHRQNPNGEKPLGPQNALDAIEAAGRFTAVFTTVMRSLTLAWNGDTGDEEAEGDADDAAPPGRGPTP